MEPRRQPGRTAAVTAAAAALLALTFGTRASFGLFVSPLNSATGLGLATISFALALSQLAWGVAQPVAGALADRHGPAPVIAAGCVLLAAASALLPFVTTAVQLGAVLAAIAVAGAAVGSSPILLGAVQQRVAPVHRGTVSGVLGAGGSLGQFVVVPAAQAAIGAAGWVGALLALAALPLAALPLARCFRRRADDAAEVPPAGPADVHGTRAALRGALGSRDWWLVTAGFFVCGFHVSFLLAHMPGVIALCGLPAALAGTWIALVGLCNIAGSLASGWAMRYLPPARMLAGLYALRALGVAAFLAAPKSATTLLAFAVWMGLTYMATLPPTSGLIARRFGTRHLGAVFGTTMLVHQVGSFLGIWLGGLAVEHTGSYAPLWQLDILLAVAAAGLHLAVREPRRELGAAERTARPRERRVTPVASGARGMGAA